MKREERSGSCFSTADNHPDRSQVKSILSPSGHRTGSKELWASGRRLAKWECRRCAETAAKDRPTGACWHSYFRQANEPCRNHNVFARLGIMHRRQVRQGENASMVDGRKVRAIIGPDLSWSLTGAIVTHSKSSAVASDVRRFLTHSCLDRADE